MSGVKISTTGKPRRAYGTGCLEEVRNGWRWRFMRARKVLTSRVWPTEAEARAELDRVVADPTFVHAPAIPREQRGRRKGKPDDIHLHRLPKGPRKRQVFSAPPVEEIPDYTDAEIAAAERQARPWGPRDASGRRKCLPCGGSGVDRRPGPGAGNACLNCDGVGHG